MNVLTYQVLLLSLSNPTNLIRCMYQWPWYLQGIRMVFADQCWHKSMTPLMESVREQMGNIPVYLTFDIDGIDLTACPGTGKRNLQLSLYSIW